MIEKKMHQDLFGPDPVKHTVNPSVLQTLLPEYLVTDGASTSFFYYIVAVLLYAEEKPS